MKHQSYAQHISTLHRGYESALQESGYERVIIDSGRGLLQRSVDDQYWPLKTNPSFSHWLPLEVPNTLIVIEPGKTPRLLRPKVDDFWHGDAPVAGDHFWAQFEVLWFDADSSATILDAKDAAWIGDSVELAESLGIASEAQNPAPLMAKLDRLRAIKSAYEIECLAEASKIATRGHKHLAELFADGGHSELELHLAYLQVTAQDSTETPYSNIVALGSNAAVLHHVHYTRTKDRRSDLSLLVDAGARYMGYASDITRTMVRGDSPEARDFSALIAGMEKIELELCAQVKPGLQYEALHNRAHELLAELLVASELCSGSPETLVAQGVTRAFFPHGLGHSLGLQVHDVGCRLVPPADENPFLRNTSLIEEGQVFTIEPGCYFIEGLLAPLRQTEVGKLVSWPAIDALRPFGGIRIEDNLVVSADASINLTRDNWPT